MSAPALSPRPAPLLAWQADVLAWSAIERDAWWTEAAPLAARYGRPRAERVAYEAVCERAGRAPLPAEALSVASPVAAPAEPVRRRETPSAPICGRCGCRLTPDRCRTCDAGRPQPQETAS